MRLRGGKGSFILSAIAAISLLGQPVGAGSLVTLDADTVGDGSALVHDVDHKKHKRRDPSNGEVIAGAVLLGILGVAAAASTDNHYNNYYYDHHEGYIRASEQNCRRVARERYNRTVGGRARAETRHVTYRGGNRYEVTGRVRRADGSRPRRFVCNTRVGQVRRLDIY